MNFYALFDSKVGIFGQPFLLRSKGEALRVFQDLVNDRSKMPALHPEDFTLFELGTYNEETGLLTSLSTPLALGKAIEFVRSDRAFGNETSVQSGSSHAHTEKFLRSEPRA